MNIIKKRRFSTNFTTKYFHGSNWLKLLASLKRQQENQLNPEGHPRD